MYRLGQIFTATEFLRHYRALTKLLAYQPQPLLITHKGGERFVFVNAEMFDELLQLRFQHSDKSLPESSIRDQIFFNHS